MKVWLAWLAVVGAVSAAAWYVLKVRATAAPTTIADPGPIVAESLPTAAGPTGPVSVWRAAVVRASIRYRDAVQAAMLASPWATGPETLRVAGVLADAATTETREELQFRLAFVRGYPLSPASRLVLSAGGDAVIRATELVNALDGLRVVVATDPGAALQVHTIIDTDPVVIDFDRLRWSA